MNIFTGSLILLDIGAAIYYIFTKDYALVGYWLLAASITICVCFIK